MKKSIFFKYAIFIFDIQDNVDKYFIYIFFHSFTILPNIFVYLFYLIKRNSIKFINFFLNFYI